MRQDQPHSRNGRGLRWAIPSAALLLAGCASSTLVNMWKDPTFQRHPLSSVVIVSMKDNEALRRLWEDGFAREFAGHGVDATPSYRLFPNRVPETDRLIDAVREKGFDGIVITHQLPTDTQVRYVPGYTTFEPVIVPSRWSGAYRTYYAGVRHPGYHEVDKIVRYQTDVWTTSDDGRMVWSGTSETFDPSSSQQVNREISRIIVPELEKQGILPAGRSRRA